MTKSPPEPLRHVSLTRKVLVFTTRLVLTSINQVVVVPGWWLVMILVQLLRFVDYSFYQKMESLLYKHLLDLVAYWGWVEGYRVIESGADIQQLSSKRCLVLPNHQSTADIVTLFAVFHNKSEVTVNVMWVSDLELMFSHVGAVMKLHGDMFVRQKLGAAQREKTLKDVETHMRNKFVAKRRRWCVVFPEGGFFRKRKAASQQYSIKKGYPVFERLSGPRVFGVEKILQSVKEADPNYPFEYLLDVIIAYQDQSRCVGLPDWLISGKYPEKVHVHYTAVPVSTLKSEATEDLERSLFKIWAEKEQKIQNFYKFGYFESEDETHKVCVFSNFRCVSLNLMYIFVTVFCAWPGAKLLYSLIV
ncbi:acyl-CoA:lysophosphatidylglycerol acyltransferase 1-like [Symsagittifera roscoffensis]|uniref:acyl-CoA:lysophosphatidylglycerol acyltransferase 1-like n=1 Tax=Symsagittifera roscoffensis TaxID=84072 RepID=UPI00307C1473